MISEKLVLGGGIAGLIFAYYNPEYKVITPEVGGQMASHFPLGPRYLHKTNYVLKFLSSLSLPAKDRLIRIGFFDGDWIDEPSKKFCEEYFRKSRDTDNLQGFNPTVMSQGMRSFTAIDVDFTELIARLSAKLQDENRIIFDQIEGIDVETCRLFGDNDTYAYHEDHLLTTIPKNKFCDLSGQLQTAKLFKAIPMSYIWCNHGL